MQYNIKGEVMQVLNVVLEEGETIYSEAGAMAWMSENIQLDAYMHGGIAQGIGRMFTGESLFLVKYSSIGGAGAISFASSFPGKILDLDISKSSLICQKDSFLAAEESVDLKSVFGKRISVGLFGGEGFLLEKLEGSGHAFLEIDGEVFERELKDGEKLKVSAGSIAMFESTVDYDIERVKGIKNMLFGGEGLFFATLTGPGKVWLQSMPVSHFAGRLKKYFPK